MDVEEIVKELKMQYPGKNIIINTPENPTEIVCEIEPASENPEKSVAIAVLDNTVKHYHRMSTETYEVLKGLLEITSAGQTYTLSPGQEKTIEPEEYHLASGKETWVKVTSEPGWTPDGVPVSSAEDSTWGE